MNEKKIFKDGVPIPIANFDFFWKYQFESINIDPACFFGVFLNHKEQLLKTWGRQDFCYTTWYRSWVWVRRLPSNSIVYVSASVRGMEFSLIPSEFEGNKQNQKEFIEWFENFKKEFAEPFKKTAKETFEQEL